jgi:hypothetical protein
VNVKKKKELASKLNKELLDYYTDKKGSFPAYYYFKNRNKKVIDYLLESVQ